MFTCLFCNIINRVRYNLNAIPIHIENWTNEKPLGKQFKKFARPNQPVAIVKPANVPSIPMRHQAYGFEEDPTSGKLVLQKPVYPGYTGLKNDKVGPMDYAPKPLDKIKSTNFAKSASRDSYERSRAEGPGPGYYNTATSTFDDPSASNIYSDGNFVMRLNTVKKRQSAAFESKTTRETMPMSKEIRPDPGSYALPPAIKVQSKPIEQQNFGSSEARIKDPISRLIFLFTIDLYIL